jgi:hypothetical protein
MNPNFFSKIPKSKDSPTGFLLLDEYAPLEMLGEGGMGQVFLGKRGPKRRAWAFATADS